MPLKKECTELSDRILLIFSRRACVRKHLPNVPEGRNRIYLPIEETGLCADVEIMLECCGMEWKIGEKKLNEKNPFYFYTENNEKLLLLLSPRKEYLMPTDRIGLIRDTRIQIGSAFKNQIFYDCYSLVNAEHAEIFSEKKQYMIYNPGFEGIYLNGNTFEGKKKLNIGDNIDIYGLHILVLKELLICVSFCGICRVARSLDMQKETKIYKEALGRKEEVWIERRCGQEKDLHTGEVEILLPEKTAPEKKQSLFLTLGPTLTMILPIFLMAQLGSRFMEGMGTNFYYLSMVMTGSSALLAFFWGIVNYGYRKQLRKKEGKERERQYKEYLEEIDNYLLECGRDNREILEQKYPPLSSLVGDKNERPAVLWNRYYGQKDFLFLRIGKGEMPFQMKVKLSNVQKSIVQGKAAKKAQDLKEKFLVLDHVPAIVDLYENRQIGITGRLHRNKNGEILLQLLMQIAACHCYTEVKIVCFYHKDGTWDQKVADCIKWMPHSWSSNKKVRFVAGDDKEAAQILPVLTKELGNRKGTADKGICVPWYIVVVLNEELIQGELLYKYLTDRDENCPASIIFAGMDREEFPKSCRCFISRTGEEGEILTLGREQLHRQKIRLEECSSLHAQNYVRNTTGFRVRETESCGQIPEEVSFLKLYGCSKIEELESGKRWRLSRTEERIKVPIGCRAGGNIVSLDVHEKFHGPHGLIAGTTGSGKSELLQTYLLSAAVSFSPADLNFFMIDYKGGGTGNLLRNLPHCAGVISNLSGKQIKRAMSAIISENKRRQRLLSSYKVNHIDAYTKLYREGKVENPMPHLILVVDEFAELKKEEPEFMREIISLSQVGRSLGVHLILATQKPAGTVDDKIWSNARFRLCLRVQDRQDSVDMLHNGDAALLTLPGQCYLQIGNHEYYELMQTGYCGGNYTEAEEGKAGAVLLKNTGKREQITDEITVSGKNSQIEMLVDYVNQTAKKYHYKSAQVLWLPELPEKILVVSLKNTDAKGMKICAGKTLEIVLGLCDDPENQCQTVLLYQPIRQGHMAICGGPSTGKTTFLKTVLWQLVNDFTPEEALIMAVSIGQKGFGCFLAMPGCLGVLGEKKDKDIFFFHLERLFGERKGLLSGIECHQYNKSGKKRIPLIFVIIDNYAELSKILNEKQQELLLNIASEGLTLGIYLILSATGPGEIGGRLYEKIKTTIALEMSDRFQYGDILRQYYIPVLPKENQKGRGLCMVQGRILEFQTALAMEGQEDYAFIQMIEERGREEEKRMREEGKALPEKIPVIPRKADYELMTEGYDWGMGKIPLGYCLQTGKLCDISVKKKTCFLISGGERTGKSTILRCLIEGALCQECKVVLIDQGKRFLDFQEREGIVYLEENGEIETWQTNFEKEKMEEKNVCVFISDMRKFCNFLYHSGENRDKRGLFWEEAAVGKGKLGLLVGIFHPGRDFELNGTVFFREFIAWQQGIHLGGNAAGQRALMFDDLGYAQQNQHEPIGIGYFKEGRGKSTRKLLLPEYTNGGKMKE